MIYADTGMERMPKSCDACWMSIALKTPGDYYCGINKQPCVHSHRRDDCPLTTAAEAMQAQLSEAKAAITSAVRILDGVGFARECEDKK